MSGFFDDADDLVSAQEVADQEARESQAWDPEPGERLTGIVLGGENITTKFGPTTRMMVRNIGQVASGGIEPSKSGFIWLSSDLERATRKQQPKVGSGIIIHFKGKVRQEKSGNMMKTFVMVSEHTDPTYWGAIFDKLDADSEGGSRGRAKRRVTGGAPGDPDDTPRKDYF